MQAALFRSGDKVVYPGHGVATVKRVENRDVGGKPCRFYVIEVDGSSVTIMAPALNTPLRSIMRERDALALLETLREPLKSDDSTWNRRYRECMELLTSGRPEATAEVFRRLVTLKRSKDMSFGERKMLDQAMSLLASEVSLAVGRTAESVDAELRGIAFGGALAND
jgi:CarD family transcriptional regulator